MKRLKFDLFMLDAVALLAPFLLLGAIFLQGTYGQSFEIPRTVDALVSFRSGTQEVALRKIDRAGLTIVAATETTAILRGKPSRARFANELIHEPEFVSVYVDRPCERFVVGWRGAKTKEALDALDYVGIKVLYRGETLPFAVCQGPLTAEIQRRLAFYPSIETVEPEYVAPPVEESE